MSDKPKTLDEKISDLVFDMVVSEVKGGKKGAKRRELDATVADIKKLVQDDIIARVRQYAARLSTAGEGSEEWMRGFESGVGIVVWETIDNCGWKREKLEGE